MRALAELQLIFSSRSRYKKSDELASVNLLVGHFPDEFAQIGCPPPTGEIPSSSCGIARDSVEAVVTDRYIVEKLRLPNERNERIQLKIQKAQRVACQLIGVCNNAGSLRGTLAGPTNEVIADGTWDETGVNQDRRVGISVVGYVGNAPMVLKRLLNRIQQQFLVERLPELLAHAAATCARTVPNDLRLVFAARIGIQTCAANRRHEW